MIAAAMTTHRPAIVRVAAVLACVAAAVFLFEGAAGLASIPGGDGGGAGIAQLCVFALGLGGFLIAGAVRLWRGSGSGMVLFTLLTAAVIIGGVFLNAILQAKPELDFVVVGLVNLVPSVVALVLVLQPATARWLASLRPTSSVSDSS